MVRLWRDKLILVWTDRGWNGPACIGVCTLDGDRERIKQFYQARSGCPYLSPRTLRMALRKVRRQPFAKRQVDAAS